MIENFLKEETISTDYYCSKCKSTSFFIEISGNVSESCTYIDCPILSSSKSKGSPMENIPSKNSIIELRLQ
jgi:hypothetical protein